MWSANCLNLDQSKILSGKGLKPASNYMEGLTVLINQWSVNVKMTVSHQSLATFTSKH